MLKPDISFTAIADISLNEKTCGVARSMGIRRELGRLRIGLHSCFLIHCRELLRGRDPTKSNIGKSICGLLHGLTSIRETFLKSIMLLVPNICLWLG